MKKIPISEIITGFVIASLGAALWILTQRWYIALAVLVCVFVYALSTHLARVRVENEYRTQKLNTYILAINPDTHIHLHTRTHINTHPERYFGSAIPTLPKHLLSQCVFVEAHKVNEQYNYEMKMLTELGNDCLLNDKLRDFEKLKVVRVPFQPADRANEEYFGEVGSYEVNAVNIIKADHQGRRLVLKNLRPDWEEEHIMGQTEKIIQ